MTYESAVAYLESIATFGIQPGLQRIEALLAALGNPQTAYKTVHVTGTNGKGSVSTFIQYGLFTSGLRVGCFTSPHLYSYTERMKVNDGYITEDAFGEVMEKVQAAVGQIMSEGVEQPTQFEVLTAAAFLFFKEQGVDYAVVEVGLGGLLDSTNVITPEVSVITNVALDHVAFCGDTVEEIASHKAGIIKPGVPVITAAQEPALSVIKKVAKEKKSKLWIFNEDFTIDSRTVLKEGQLITWKDTDGASAMLFTNLHGVHQAVNISVAMKALMVLKGKETSLSDEIIREGLARAKWPGRFEVHQVNQRTIILDGAHNENGAEAFALTYKEIFKDAPKTVVTAILEDKDVSGIVSHVVGMSDTVITVPAPTPRSSDPHELAKKMPVKAEGADTVTAGLEKAMASTKAGDIIAVCGSLYILGEVQQWLREQRSH